MPETTPGERAYETYVAHMEAQAALFPWRFLPQRTKDAWEAAAQAVLTDDSDGRDSVRAHFRYAFGALLRLAGSPCPWTVVQRRWVDRQIMPPYAEYAVQSPESLVCWEVEADLVPWEDPHA